MESIEQTLNGNPVYGGSATATISRNGDLVYRMWIEHSEKLEPRDFIVDPNPVTTVLGQHKGLTAATAGESTTGDANGRYDLTRARHIQSTSIVNNWGAGIIKEVEIEIGGQTIDRHTSH